MKRIHPKRTRKQGKQRQLRMEPLEQRLCLAASLGWDGPGLGTTSLTYYIGNVPASVGLEQAEVETAIETALDAWAQVADVTFTQTTLARQSNSLDITFGSIDGSGGILAQAYLPAEVNPGRLAGDIEFDLGDPWEIGNAAGSAAFDLVYVATHEIGHALGLDHMSAVGSVMRPTVSPSQVFTTLATVDMNAILGLYAAAPGDTTGTGGTNSGGTNSGGTGNPDGGETLPRWHSWNHWGWFAHFGGRQPRGGSATAETLIASPSHHNITRPADVNGDNDVSAVDALMIINFLNTNGSRGLGSSEGEGGALAMIDVSGDDHVTAVDALMVINELNKSMLVSIPIEEPVDNDTVTQPDTSPVDDNTVATDTTDDSGSTDDAEDESKVDDGPVVGGEHDCNGRQHNPLAGLDANGDGALTADEVPDALWQRLLAADANSDGSISAAELEAIAREHHRPDPFAAFDANNDGSLTVDEVSGQLWTRLSQADADKNDAVTMAELAAARASAEMGPAGHHEGRFGHHRR